MKVEKVKLSKLKPLETNVRRHTDKQINELVRSLEQFGQTRAMVIDENNEIMIGNGLYQALVKMGADDAEVYKISGLSDVQKKKLILSDNKIYALGSDDYDGITAFVNEVTKAGDFDIAGFDTYTLEALTIDEVENEQSMRSYGTVTEENLMTSTPQHAAQSVQNNAGNDFEDNSDNLSTSRNDEPVGHPEAVRRSVVCPNCGEVIYLD